MRNVKSFNLRMQKEIWMWLKSQSVVEELSMTDIVIHLIEKYKNKCEKVLTNKDALV